MIEAFARYLPVGTCLGISVPFEVRFQGGPDGTSDQLTSLPVCAYQNLDRPIPRSKDYIENRKKDRTESTYIIVACGMLLGSNTVYSVLRLVY